VIFSPIRTKLRWVVALGTHGKMLASATRITACERRFAAALTATI
jgi:hypothetical protein